MSLATYLNSNRPNASATALKKRGVKAVSVTPAIIGRLRKALAAAGQALTSAYETLAEARLQKAMIEAELYRNRYMHASKNDDDLPVIR